VLKSFINAQKPGALDKFELTLGQYKKLVNLKIPLAFIIGDAQGGDNICGRSAYYNQDARRISQMCNATPSFYEGEIHKSCKLLNMNKIKTWVKNNKNDKLHNLMQSKHWQAFFDIDYGGCPGGVFTAACPPEALHALENGIILHCLKEVFQEILTPAQHCKLDQIVQTWTKLPCQKYLKSNYLEYPRLYFGDGISTITETSAVTKVGIMFALVIASITVKGKKVLTAAENPNFEDYSNMIYVFEMLLCYWSWLKKDTYWKWSDKQSMQLAEQAISTMLQNVQDLFPRSSGSN